MFDYHEKQSPMAKAFTLSAIGMGVGFGTCGLTVLTNAGNGQFWIVAVMGAGLFFLSFLTMLGTILVFIVNSIRETFRK
jgi:hypothetical protein